MLNNEINLSDSVDNQTQDSLNLSTNKEIDIFENATIDFASDSVDLTKQILLHENNAVDIKENIKYQKLAELRDTTEFNPSDNLDLTRSISMQDSNEAQMQDSLMQKGTQKDNANDSVELPNDSILIHEVKTNTDTLPRFWNITNEAQALAYFINEIQRRYRFNQYETMINNIQTLEIEDAIYDALEEINQTPDFTKYDLLHFVKKGVRYRRVLILGSAKNILNTLISLWSANGMDVSIEDLSVDSKLGDLESLYDKVKDEFVEALNEMKQYDRQTITSSRFGTGRYRFGSSSFGFRIGGIMSKGGVIR